MRVFATFKARPVLCENRHRTKPLVWSYDPDPACETCGAPTYAIVDEAERAHAVHGDEIDVIRRDGVCHADGTPRRFRSRAELAATEKALGWRRLESGEKFPKSEPRAPRPRVIRPQY